MPSPGRMAIFIMSPAPAGAAQRTPRSRPAGRSGTRACASSNRCREPRLPQEAFRLEGLDRFGMAQGERDVVVAAEKTELAKRLDLEGQRLAAGPHHDLTLQIDRQRVADEGRHLVEERTRLVLAEDDRQQAVLEAVVEEDVGVAGREDGAKAILLERPWRMLARRTAAEVLACQEDGRALEARLVENEVRIRSPRC